jgi:hypothetical protein
MGDGAVVADGEAGVTAGPGRLIGVVTLLEGSIAGRLGFAPQSDRLGRSELKG